MRSSASIVRALAGARQAHSEANLEWIRSGLFGAAYPALLVETYHYVSHSIMLLSRACSLLHSRTAIQRYFIKHMAEEVGHEQWALEDLEALGIAPTDVLASEPLPETVRLVATQLFLIEHSSPVSILGYIYAMESMPPNQSILGQISDAYAIPQNALNFLMRHGQADISHHQEILDVIDENIASAAERDAVITAAAMAIENLNNIFRRLRAGDFVGRL